MQINIRLVTEETRILGQELCPEPKLKTWAKKTGFVNIRELVFKVPCGPWPKDTRLKEIVAWNQLHPWKV